MESQERLSKRRKADTGYSPPVIEGATAQVRGWSYGNLSKRDATRFFRAVSSFVSLQLQSGLVNFVVLSWYFAYSWLIALLGKCPGGLRSVDSLSDLMCLMTIFLDELFLALYFPVTILFLFLQNDGFIPVIY